MNHVSEGGGGLSSEMTTWQLKGQARGQPKNIFSEDDLILEENSVEEENPILEDNHILEENHILEDHSFM